MLVCVANPHDHPSVTHFFDALLEHRPEYVVRLNCLRLCRHTLTSFPSLCPCAIASTGLCRLRQAPRIVRYASRLPGLASAPVPVLAHRLHRLSRRQRSQPEAGQRHSSQVDCSRFRHCRQAAVVQSPQETRQPERLVCHVPVLARCQQWLEGLRCGFAAPNLRGCARIQQGRRGFWGVCVNPANQAEVPSHVSQVAGRQAGHDLVCGILAS